jgi:hypothetical protein
MLQNNRNEKVGRDHSASLQLIPVESLRHQPETVAQDSTTTILESGALTL